MFIKLISDEIVGGYCSGRWYRMCAGQVHYHAKLLESFVRLKEFNLFLIFDENFKEDSDVVGPVGEPCQVKNS